MKPHTNTPICSKCSKPMITFFDGSKGMVYSCVRCNRTATIKKLFTIPKEKR